MVEEEASDRKTTGSSTPTREDIATEDANTDNQLSPAVRSQIEETLASVIPATPTNDSQARSPARPNGSPDPKRNRAVLTPEGKRYQVLYDQLKVRYRQQEQAYNGSMEMLNVVKEKLAESERKRTTLDEQLTQFATTNETLQKLESYTVKSTEETTNELVLARLLCTRLQ